MTQADTPATVATPAASDEERPARPVRLHHRLIRRFEGQIQLPGGLVINGVGKLGVVFVALFAAVALTVVVTRWESQAKVPALIGATRQEAEARLEKAHLMVGGIQYEESTEPLGTVLRTDPRIGTSLARDSGVILMLARPFGGNPSPLQTVPISPSAGAGDLADSLTGGQSAGGSTSVNSAAGGTSSGGRTPSGGTNSGGTNSGTKPGGLATAGTDTNGTTPGKPATVSLAAGRVEPDPDFDRCDTGYQVIFTQPVSMSGPGQVTYRWLRSDGAQAAVETLVFGEAGTRTVETTWLRGGAPGETLDGWQRLEVLSPTEAYGGKLFFEHTCSDNSD